MTRPGNRAAALVVSARSWPPLIADHGLWLCRVEMQRRERFDESWPSEREPDGIRESEPVLRTRPGKEES